MPSLTSKPCLLLAMMTWSRNLRVSAISPILISIISIMNWQTSVTPSLMASQLSTSSSPLPIYQCLLVITTSALSLMLTASARNWQISTTSSPIALRQSITTSSSTLQIDWHPLSDDVAKLYEELTDLCHIISHGFEAIHSDKVQSTIDELASSETSLVVWHPPPSIHLVLNTLTQLVMAKDVNNVLA